MPQFRRSCASRRSNKAAAPKTRPGSLSRRHQHPHPHSAPAAGARSQGRTHQVPDAEDDGAGADMAAEAAAVGVETCPGRAQHLGGSSGLCRSAPLSGLIRGAGPDWGRPLGGRDRQHGPGGRGELCGPCGHLYPQHSPAQAGRALRALWVPVPAARPGPGGCGELWEPCGHLYPQHSPAQAGVGSSAGPMSTCTLSTARGRRAGEALRTLYPQHSPGQALRGPRCGFRAGSPAPAPGPFPGEFSPLSEGPQARPCCLGRARGSSRRS